MSGVKHTPGPWELVSLSGYGSPFSIRMPYIETSASAGQTHYGVQSIRRREDALLIAAAPDLLEALERSAEGWANALELKLIPPQHRDTATILRDEARAAIARARGEQDGGGE